MFGINTVADHDVGASIRSITDKELQQMYLDNKYTTWYYSIINKAFGRVLPTETYTEKHHIIPSSLGGTNDKNNLVKLTAKEHFICHLLLTKMLTGREKALMEFAHQRMCYGKPGTQRYMPSAYRLRIARSPEQRSIVSHKLKRTTTAKDKQGNTLRASIDDERWKTGELVGTSKGSTFTRETQKNKALAKDPVTNCILGLIDKNDPRWKTGEIVFHLCGVKGNRAKTVHTPLGTFRSLGEAASHHSLSTRALGKRVRSSDIKYNDYFYC